MKPRLNREIVIGLSILSLLLVTFAGLVIRRCLRHEVPLESVAALEEVRHEEDHAEHRAEREAGRLQKPDVLTPVASVGHDNLHVLDDPGHWKSEKERHKEGFPAAGPIADPAVLTNSLEVVKPHKHEAQRTSTFASSETPAVASDDRYGISSQPSPGVHRKPDSSQSTVIQVSDGESSDASPRPLDRYEHREEHQDHHDRQGQAGTAAGDTIPAAPMADPGMAPAFRPAAGMPQSDDATRRHAEKVLEHQLRETAAARDNAPAMPMAVQSPAMPYAPAAGMPIDAEAARRQAERARERGYQGAGGPVAIAAPRSTYAGEPRSASPEASPPGYGGVVRMSDERGMGYGAPPGGYAPDRLPRGEVRPREAGREQVPLRDDGMYEVQPNDSYWTISERVYGSGAYFRALAEANRGRAARPDRLPPGLLIATPPVARLEKDYPDLCPRPVRRETVRNRAAAANLAATAGGGRTYVVQEGDTLSSIARNELGKVSRWAEIYQLNREALGKDYDYLTPGMRLVLPIRDSQQGDRTTRRDDSGAPLMR